MSDQPAPKPKPEPRVFFVNKVESGQHQDDLGLLPRYLVEKQTGPIVQSQAREIEDEFQGVNDLRRDQSVVQPLFDPRILARLAWRNNILPPLIEAMEVNIDGTGAEIVALEEEEIQDPAERAEKERVERDAAFEKKRRRQEAFESGNPFLVEDEPEDEEALAGKIEMERQKMGVEAWFDEPWPGESFLTIRRKLRRDLEETGNGFLEVLRNVADEVIFARHIDAKTIRLVKLDAAVIVNKSVIRGGDEIEAQVLLRERRYVQIIAGNFVYFREFSSSRQLDRDTGRWEGDPGIDVDTRVDGPQLDRDSTTGAPIEFNRRATEIIHFTNKRDPESPYGIPRWISNAPSVVGSRRAEEFNLDFFDAGGVPPLMIIVQGGKLAENAEKALREHFLASGVARHQAAVLEAFSTTGDINSAQNVRVTVERFGADRQKDSMFETYIKNCDMRTERSFRLPPLFLGATDDASFATAFASYTVAEAQVFKPERDEFDEIINLKLLPALPNGDKFKYRSLPVVAVGAERQLEAMQMVKDMVDRDELVEEVNQIANLSLKPKSESDEGLLNMPLGPGIQPESQDDIVTADDEPKPGQPKAPVPGGQPRGNEPKDSVPDGARPEVTKRELRGLQVLADDIARQMDMGFRDDQEIAKFAERLAEVQTLQPAQEATFKRHLAHALFDSKDEDPEGAVALAEGLLRQLASQYGN